MEDEQRTAINWYLSLLHQTSIGTLAGATINVEPSTWHIFQNRQDLMTDLERQTTQYLAMLSYARASTTKRERIRGFNKAQRMLSPEIEGHLKDGEEAFLVSVRDRILQEHGAGILNLCPRCGTLARTAQAKQCHKCFYDWHN
jgi:hypothetical protein